MTDWLDRATSADADEFNESVPVIDYTDTYPTPPKFNDVRYVVPVGCQFADAGPFVYPLKVIQDE